MGHTVKEITIPGTSGVKASYSAPLDGQNSRKDSNNFNDEDTGKINPR